MENKTDFLCCKNPKMVLAILGMILLSTIVIVSILRDRIVNQPQWTINISGQGKVSYQPDIANITIGFQVDKATKADEALTQLNTKMNKIYQAVQELDIPQEDIQTQNYSLYSQYDYIDGVSKLSGYNANQILVVKARNIQEDKAIVNKVVSAVTKAGANQINGISFEASNLNELKQQARLKAITDAKAKANETAKALGIKLGKIVGWWENFMPLPESLGYAKGDMGGIGGGAAGGPVISSGGYELIVEVNLNYKIK